MKKRFLRDIAEIQTGPFGSQLHKEDYVDVGTPIVTVEHLGSRVFSEQNLPMVSEADKSRLSKYVLKKGDIVFSRVGSVDRCSFVDQKHDGWMFSGRCLRVRPNEEVDSLFLYYFFCLNATKEFVRSIAVGATMPSINTKLLGEVEVICPEIEEQRKIADILSKIDDKIEENQKINNNLEQQARSLFKSWFVDYIPFGNTMPSNWKNGKLKDILKLKRKSIKAGINTVLPYLPIDVIPMRTFALTDFKPNAEAQSSLLTFEKDDIIIGAMRVYFHRVVLAPCDGITRTTCFTLAPYHKEYLSFALLCCDQDSSIDYAQSTSKGSTMPYAIWEGGLGDMEIAIPTLEIAQEFNEIVLPMLRQIQNSYFENNRLREIRDGLIPRLMSGELDVSDIDL